jgi:hypothetical protein
MEFVFSHGLTNTTPTLSIELLMKLKQKMAFTSEVEIC